VDPICPEGGFQKESLVIQRRTQTKDYWCHQFELTDRDATQLYDLILDEGKPVSTATLAQLVVECHCRWEEKLIEEELSKGAVYQPQDLYEVGEQIIFPALNYVLGTVVDTRPGQNPDYDDFTVIQVQFDEQEVREFASGLQGEHRLNRGERGPDLIALGDLLLPAQLYEKYSSCIDEKLVAFLHDHGDFVHLGDEWFLKGLLVEVHTGQLNIAEALIEVKAMPVPTTEFLDDLDIPTEVAEEVRVFSLNFALEADGRFDNVGDVGRDIWYLRRLTPELVVKPSPRLDIEIEPYERDDISQELLLIEREIDDEGSGEEVMGSSRPIYRTTIALIYPHWRTGTLPLTVRTRGLFPQAATHHTPIVLVDGQTGGKMQGWVVHRASFVYGLEEWYEKYRLPVGAYIKLERTRDPRVITVDFEPRRLKNLWVPIATVEGGVLTFQMRKQPIRCDYDEHLAMGEDNSEEMEALWAETQARGESLFQVMVRIMPELAELSPQGTVHAKTIYSAVNVLKRTPPGPIFSLLSAEPCFVAMGGGYWSFDSALVRH
jgi:hypothetical protein